MGLDFQLIQNNIACVTRHLRKLIGFEMNKTNDFRLLIDVLRDPRAFQG